MEVLVGDEAPDLALKDGPVKDKGSYILDGSGLLEDYLSDKDDGVGDEELFDHGGYVGGEESTAHHWSGWGLVGSVSVFSVLETHYDPRLVSFRSADRCDYRCRGRRLQPGSTVVFVGPLLSHC